MLGVECAHPYRCANLPAPSESHVYQSHAYKHVSHTARVRLHQQQHKRDMRSTRHAKHK